MKVAEMKYSSSDELLNFNVYDTGPQFMEGITLFIIWEVSIFWKYWHFII